MADEKSVGFFNTSGPKRQISIGSGLAAGVGTALLGAAALPVAIVALGTTAAVWNGLKLFSK
jgi:hypothetical protein